MSLEGRPPETPTCAAGDSIILHVPACVQRFSSRRRVLSRLRAMARRRSRGLPELEAAPLKLQVEENPNWPAAVEQTGTERGLQIEDWHEEGNLFSLLPDDLEAEPALFISEATSEPVVEIEREPPEDPEAVAIQQLEEDNRDLKAALCQLIRIAEENNAALRLLEEENEELSALVHRLTTGEPAGARRQTLDARQPRWLPAWNGIWMKRRLDRRCT
jgi:hypothetical protein